MLAHLVVQVVLDFILLMKAGGGISRLGPKVGNVIGAAQFQRYKMIDFILPCRVTDTAVLDINLVFLA